MHKARPSTTSTTLYYKACTKHVPVLLSTSKLVHNTSQITSSLDTQQASPHSKLLHTASFYYAKSALTHSKLLRRQALNTQRAFTRRKLLHTESFYTHKALRTASFYTRSSGAKQPPRSHDTAFCSITWQTRISLRTWQQNVTPIMQPFHCDLQPQLPKHPVATHTRTTTRCRTQRRNRFDDETTAAAIAAHTHTHTRCLLSPPAPLYTELKDRGPDNPTSQLLPVMSNKCCSGTGKEGKTKEVVEDREAKIYYVKSCVCVCVIKLCVKDACDTIMCVCVKDLSYRA